LAHLLREAEDLVANHETVEPIYRYLEQLFVGLQAWLETDSTNRGRAHIHRTAQRGLRTLVERSEPDGPVATLCGKTDGRIDHWLDFVGEPAVSPTNNDSKNTLREPVVLRKIIGNFRNDH